MKILLLSILVVFLAGCSEIPIKKGGVPIGKDTTATMDDFGVAKVVSEF